MDFSSDVEVVSSSEGQTTDLATNALNQFLAINGDHRQRTAVRPRASSLVCVSVPKVADEHEYSYLPGYSRVDKIVSKVNDDAYQIEMESGDTIQVSYNPLLDLQGGPAALAGFKKARPRKSQAIEEGFVNVETLVFSSDEEDQPTRRRRKPASDISSVSHSPSQSSESDSASESASESASVSSSPGVRRSRRVVLRPKIRSFISLQDDSDELNAEVTVRKGRRSRASKLKEKGTKPLRQGTRASDRIRTGTQRNMLERLEDDISEVEVKRSDAKYSGAREVFEVLARDDPFRLRHQRICGSCSLGENSKNSILVFCQGCTSSYHKTCLGPRAQRVHLATKASTGYFVLQCRACVGASRAKDQLAPHLGNCAQCNEPGALSQPLRTQMTARQEQLQREENGGVDPSVTVDADQINNPNNVMFRCTTCKRGWHLAHLPPKSRRQSRIVVDTDEDDDEQENDDQLAKQRFREYSRGWECHDCENAPGVIETLVAWRPVDLDSYTPGYTSDMISEESKEYLVKWKKMSHFHATWMPGSWVWGVTIPPMLKAFHRSSKALKPCMTTEDAIPEEFLLIDIVLDVRYSNVVSNRTKEIDLARIKEVKEVFSKYKGLPYEAVVWEKPPSPDDTDRWQSFQAAYEEWVKGNYIHPPHRAGLHKHLASARTQEFGRYWVKQTQPRILTGGQLMPYQQEGLNWIYYMWFQQKNAILADEMGLGKTIQVIAFLATLVQDHSCWPFLVVVPNSTVPNWRSEIKTWAATLRAVTYFGVSAARKIQHDYEMFPGNAAKSDLRCHIVITSYETMIDDHARRIFSAIPWQGLVVDEGHRLKNDKNQLYESLSKIHFPFKLLLTGTPLQNNIRELFNIIQFCDSSKDANVLEAQYQNLTKENVNELHEMIRPVFLRRTKAQVLTFLKPMAQIIVPVSMTIVQKKLYKSILAKNPQLIKAIFKRNEGKGLKQTERHNLNNILMQLRKCLCHPFVYSKAIEERGVNATLLYRNLVEASSKLQLLELLLPKLQQRGHRVLIFSQFLDFLDIIEDFLDGLGMMHLRLDGSLSSLQRQKRIDAFNAPNSPYFVFMLSTRAGGVGINLATADTVIIMDPDFNPHQDIQALSRAHRIGQKKKVLVFQLMTKGSAEEKIMQIGKKKMALDHVLIERMDAEEDKELDIESVLRFGAEELFDDNDKGDVHYDNESIEKLLDRSKVEDTRVGDDSSAESQFSFARVWTNRTANFEDQLGESGTATPNSTVWEKILKEREHIAEQEAKTRAETLGRGKRKRQVVDYAIPDNPTRNQSDSESAVIEGESDADDFKSDAFSSPERAQKRPTPRNHDSALARPYKRAKVPPPQPTLEMAMYDGTPYEPENESCIACNEIHPRGSCGLKRAGVEHCGLCGIAHFGYSRTCPHLNSEVQVASMLSSLKESTEQRALIEEATRYLRGIRGDLVRRRKAKVAKEQMTNPQNATAQMDMSHIRGPPIAPRPAAFAQAPGPGPGPGPALAPAAAPVMAQPPQTYEPKVPYWVRRY